MFLIYICIQICTKNTMMDNDTDSISGYNPQD